MKMNHIISAIHCLLVLMISSLRCVTHAYPQIKESTIGIKDKSILNIIQKNNKKELHRIKSYSKEQYPHSNIPDFKKTRNSCNPVTKACLFGIGYAALLSVLVYSSYDNQLY